MSERFTRALHVRCGADCRHLQSRHRRPHCDVRNRAARLLSKSSSGSPMAIRFLCPARIKPFIAYAAAFPYRSRPCYDGVREFSVYVAREGRGQGFGKAALGALIDDAKARGWWKLLSRIFPENTVEPQALRRAWLPGSRHLREAWPARWRMARYGDCRKAAELTCGK